MLTRLLLFGPTHYTYITYGIYRPLRNLEINTAISTFDVCADSGFQCHDVEPVMMVKFNVKSKTLNFATHDFSDTDSDFVHFSVMDAEISVCLLFVVTLYVSFPYLHERNTTLIILSYTRRINEMNDVMHPSHERS